MFARVRAEVSAPALAANLRALSAHAGARVLLPVKANAYGHGLELVARLSEGLPEVWGYGVATPLEAAALRASGVRKPVLLLTPAAPEELSELLALDVQLTVSSAQEAARLPAGARAHLKINTGMNRLGVRPEEALELARQLQARGQLAALFTHFASSEGPDLESAEAQLARFRAITTQLPGVMAHASNSGAVYSFGPRAAFDLIRPGIASYGYAPEAHLRGHISLTPALTLRARVNHLHSVPAGEGVSYGALWTAARDTRVAVLGLGYADGYPRPATGQARVRLSGVWRPVLGRICMDQCMADASGLDVAVGDWAEVFGPGEVDADTVAGWAGTISYEVLTGLGGRVEREAAVTPPVVQAR